MLRRSEILLHASLKLELSSRQHCESLVPLCSPPCSHTAIAVSVSLIAGDYHQTSYSVVAARAPDVDTFVSWLGFHFGNTILAHGAAAPVILHPRPKGLKSVITPPTSESDGSGARVLLNCV